MDGVYYLAAGLWAGAIAMLALGAPQSFDALRNAQPPTPRADELAGLVVNRMVDSFMTLALICAGVVMVCAVLQLGRAAGRWGAANLARLALLAGAFAILLVMWLGVIPAMHAERAAMHDSSLSDAARAESRIAFMRLHKVSERFIGADGLAVAVAVLISPVAGSIQSKDQGADHG